MLLALAASLLLAAEPAPAAVVTATEAWVRLPPPGNRNTGAFMRLTNPSAAARKLVKAANPASKVTELHTHVEEGGVMKMRPVPAFELPAGGALELKPGSFHVMLIDLVAPLKEGEVVALTLTFDDGSTLEVKAPVRKLDLPMKP